MDFNEIEATYFEYKDSNSSRYQEILNILDNMLRDKKLGIVKSRDGDKALLFIRAEDFQHAFNLLQNRLSLHAMQDVISFRLIRNDDSKPKRTNLSLTFGEDGKFHQN